MCIIYNYAEIKAKNMESAHEENSQHSVILWEHGPWFLKLALSHSTTVCYECPEWRGVVETAILEFKLDHSSAEHSALCWARNTFSKLGTLGKLVQGFSFLYHVKKKSHKDQSHSCPRMNLEEMFPKPHMSFHKNCTVLLELLVISQEAHWPPVWICFWLSFSLS